MEIVWTVLERLMNGFLSLLLLGGVALLLYGLTPRHQREKDAEQLEAWLGSRRSATDEEHVCTHEGRVCDPSWCDDPSCPKKASVSGEDE